MHRNKNGLRCNCDCDTRQRLRLWPCTIYSRYYFWMDSGVGFLHLFVRIVAHGQSDRRAGQRRCQVQSTLPFAVLFIYLLSGWATLLRFYVLLPWLWLLPFGVADIQRGEMRWEYFIVDRIRARFCVNRWIVMRTNALFAAMNNLCETASWTFSIH